MPNELYSLPYTPQERNDVNRASDAYNRLLATREPGTGLFGGNQGTEALENSYRQASVAASDAIGAATERANRNKKS